MIIMGVPSDHKKLKNKQMKKLIFLSLIVLAIITSCHNQDQEFPDYDYTTAYFAYQTPIRTLVLGEDIYDNSLDNAHKCTIIATMGGVYKNKEDRILDVVVDNSLAEGLFFEGDSDNYVLPLPAEYYSLASDKKIVIPSGSVTGGIEVQFTDAFFADPKSIKNTFVIPLRINSASNIDSVLRGKAFVENPNLFIASNWSIAPKDYILYCVKYVNPWHGAYLRRGIDIGTGNIGYSRLDTTSIYHNQFVEKDQVVKTYTVSMNEVMLTLNTRNKGNTDDISFTLLINIDNNGKCSVAAPDAVSYKITGNGEFIKDGDMWGGEPKDVMHLKYSVDFDSCAHSFTDTLVLRDRNIKMETFNPVVSK
jgi:hypothetical protein